ncbi:GAF domain-containing protein [Streptosporangium subroseum]|uniref:GAF domain-containing protein n=1 Tax=Streptosporangium subroseum TaxID=106412 RepID=A0A239P9U5_9ACTN|nr:GAF and ANTAR domain-containing protein [Streptosporangium subroseum]SNT63807.1 GAF domain-containing protein [Streptosporangium subroseum]
MSEVLYRRTAQVFVELADTLVAGFDVIDFLQMLAEHTVEIFEVDAAAILLADQRGALILMAASDDEVRLLELFQLQEQEGPCLDCFHSGEPVTCTDLSADSSRWPLFSAAAHEVGLHAVHAFPLRLRDQVLGTLGLFNTVPAELPQDTISVAQALADVATIGILNERTLREQHVITEQLQYALNSPVLIEQAKGMLAERARIDVGHAFTVIRKYARDHNRTVSSVAQDLISNAAGTTDLIAAAVAHRATRSR